MPDIPWQVNGPARRGWTSASRARLDPSWLHPLRSRAGARARVVVFAHAGSGPLAYRRVLDGLPTEVDVLGATLPGHDGRADLRPSADMDAVLHGLVHVLDHLGGMPTILFGHSLGSALAALTAQGMSVPPRGLVLSAGFPGTQSHPLARELYTEAGLATLLRRHSLPVDALTRAAGLTWRQRALAGDLELASAAVRALDACHLQVPISAVAGANDLTVPPEAVAGWGEKTDGYSRYTVVRGAHLFPFLPNGARVIRGEVTRLLRRTPMSTAS